MPDHVESTATTYSPQRCRELVEHFRDQVLEFARKLDSFPPYFESALAADPEALAWALIALGVGEDLVGPPLPEGFRATIQRMEAGEIPFDGLLGQLSRHRTETERDRVYLLGHVITNLEQEEKGARNANAAT